MVAGGLCASTWHSTASLRLSRSFGSDQLDKVTLRTARAAASGLRMVLKQDQYVPLTVEKQVLILLRGDKRHAGRRAGRGSAAVLSANSCNLLKQIIPRY